MSACMLVYRQTWVSALVMHWSSHVYMCVCMQECIHTYMLYACKICLYTGIHA